MSLLPRNDGLIKSSNFPIFQNLSLSELCLNVFNSLEVNNRSKSIEISLNFVKKINVNLGSTDRKIKTISS